MDFVRSYFLKNETLGSCPFLSSKLDSPVMKLLERPNVLITGVSNFDERNCPEFHS
jgi:hypothetical protein